jgi:thiamine-phosphate pyrophosphorylase
MATTKAERAARLRGLYAITPECDDDEALVALVRQAIAGGAKLVQYRAKRLGALARARQARALALACRERGVLFIVNDDAALARECGADGVHLGAADGDPRAARAAWPEAILGVSCYDQPGLARAAAEAGADYVGIGSLFASRVKPGAVQAPLERLSQARAASGLPVAAIGGITADNASLAIAAGADMIAVISALFDAPDVVQAARALSRPFDPEHFSHVRTQPATL